MLKKRVIPCLLLKDSGLVKTVNFSDPKYIGDPINAVKIFNNKEVDEIIFLDISKRRPPFELLSKIASEAFMPFSYGGGIENLEDIEKILNIGIEKVALNTNAVKNPEIIKQAAERFGSQSIIVSIDIKDNKVFTEGGRNNTGLNPVKWAQEAENLGAGEIFLNSIDKDGTMQGYDLELIKKVSEAVNIPVVASGGAGKAEDFNNAFEAGASAVSAGSMFVFYGKNRSVLINYPEKI